MENTNNTHVVHYKGKEYVFFESWEKNSFVGIELNRIGEDNMNYFVWGAEARDELNKKINKGHSRPATDKEIKTAVFAYEQTFGKGSYKETFDL